MIKVFRKIFKPFHLLLIIATIVSLLAPYINPSISPIPSYFGIIFFPLYILLALSTVFIVRKKITGKTFLSSIIVLALGWFSLGKYINFNKHLVNKKGIKISTYNANLFGHFENLSDGKYGGNYLDSALELIVGTKPDILCVQEFLSKKINGQSTVQRIKQRTGLKHHYFEILNDGREVGRFGLILFSKYKIVNHGYIDFEFNTGNLCLFSDLLIGKDTIRVYSTHMQSVRFSHNDYKFLRKIPEDNKEKIEGGKKISKRLSVAYKNREKQAKILKKHLNNCSYKIILCGDFNDMPLSYTYRILSHQLQDAFCKQGYGFERTYKGRLPVYRIDYILSDPSFKVINYKSIDRSPSDHKIVSAEIKIQ